MLSRRQKRALLLRILLIVLLVAALITGILYVQSHHSQSDPEPAEVTLNVHISAEGLEGDPIQVAPYSIVEPGKDPLVQEVASLDLPESAVSPEAVPTLLIDLPRSIYDHDWSVVTIYDNPAYNNQDFFSPYEVQQLAIPLFHEDADRARLVVTEIKTILIGHDENGEETPYTVTWSILIN